jgi:hypothetical protein
MKILTSQLCQSCSGRLVECECGEIISISANFCNQCGKANDCKEKEK